MASIKLLKWYCMPSHVRWFVLLVFACCSSLQAQISKGHQILINRGFQVAGNVSPTDPFHLDTFSNANYTTMFWMWDRVPSEMGPAPGYPWASWIRNINEMPPLTGESPYLSQIVML